MTHSAKKQHHELARKKRKHDQLEHARELAKKEPSNTAAWVLGIGLAVMLTAVLAVTLF